MNLRVGERVEVKVNAAPPIDWARGLDFVPGVVKRVGCGDPLHPCYLLEFQDHYVGYVYAEHIRRLERTPFEERVYAYIERELSS